MFFPIFDIHYKIYRFSLFFFALSSSFHGMWWCYANRISADIWLISLNVVVVVFSLVFFCDFVIQSFLKKKKENKVKIYFISKHLHNVSFVYLRLDALLCCCYCCCCCYCNCYVMVVGLTKLLWKFLTNRFLLFDLLIFGKLSTTKPHIHTHRNKKNFEVKKKLTNCSLN